MIHMMLRDFVADFAGVGFMTDEHFGGFYDVWGCLLSYTSLSDLGVFVEMVVTGVEDSISRGGRTIEDVFSDTIPKRPLKMMK